MIALLMFSGSLCGLMYPRSCVAPAMNAVVSASWLSASFFPSL